MQLEKISEFQYRIPKESKPGMLVDGVVYADEELMVDIQKDKALEQVANVAFLPGIVNASLAMPDIHWGYGFPIGGVAATDPDKGGVISPGGVGFDINCGVRMLRTDLVLDDVKDKLSVIADRLYSDVPCGLGSKGDIRLSTSDYKKVVLKGAEWAVSQGMGTQADLDACEDNGAIDGADLSVVSEKAYLRGKKQMGSLGSGNHFLEVQVIEEIFDDELANKFNLSKGQISLMIHSGSRGFGYQVCDEHVREMGKCLDKYGISVPDRQLGCAPINSPEAEHYIAAMRAAANYAWCNRQVLMHLSRLAFEKIFSQSWQSLGMNLIYDVAHNIAKFEKYTIDGKEKTLCVHRKGATRCFPDQPVIIPGDMGTASYLLIGQEKAKETFFSCCHGAGRVKSRSQALKTLNFNDLMDELDTKGIEVRAHGKKTIIEEAPQVYKDVSKVVDVVVRAGLAKKVCKMRPLAVVKG